MYIKFGSIQFIRFQALVTDITRVTHSNRLAINGAVLQCMAIHCALKMASTPQTTKSSSHIVNEFVDYLLGRIQSIESADNGRFQSDIVSLAFHAMCILDLAI